METKKMGTFLDYHKTINAALDQISEIDIALEAEDIKEEEKKALTEEREKVEKTCKKLQSDALEAIVQAVNDDNLPYLLQCLAANDLKLLYAQEQMAQAEYDGACKAFQNVTDDNLVMDAFQKRKTAEKALAEAKTKYEKAHAEYSEEFGTTAKQTTATQTGNKTATATRGSRAAMLGYMQKHGTESFSASDLAKVEEVVSKYETGTPAASISRDLTDFLNAGKVKVVGTTPRGGRIFQAV